MNKEIDDVKKLVDETATNIQGLLDEIELKKEKKHLQEEKVKIKEIEERQKQENHSPSTVHNL